MAGGLLSSGVGGLSTGACGPGAGGVAFPTRDGTLSDTRASVDLTLDCGNLTISTAAGNTWRVEGRDANGSGPDIAAGGTSLRVDSRNDGRGPFGFLGDREEWQITLPAGPRLDLDLEVNAGSATADLGSASLGDLRLNLNAGSATVDLGAAHAIAAIDAKVNAGSLGITLPNLSLGGSIRVNAGSVKLCAHPGAALRLHTGQSIMASYDYAGHGLVQDGSTWSTPGFDAAAVRIELRTEANAGSFALDPEGGCE